MKYLILVLGLSLCSFAKADVAPAHLEKVNELFEVMSLKDQMSEGFDAMMPVIDELSKQLDLNEEEKKELRAIYKEWFDKDIDRDSIMKKLAVLYAETFTVDEINQLIAFYETDLGQKLIVKTPELMKMGAELGMNAAMAKQDLLQERIQAFMMDIQNKRNAEE